MTPKGAAKPRKKRGRAALSVRSHPLPTVFDFQTRLAEDARVAAGTAQLERETLIGTGLTSEVYTWGSDKVLKLFVAWRRLGDVQKEFAVSQAVHGAGVPSPAAFEVLEVGDRLGIVFERLHGPSLAGRIESRPWTLFQVARQLAELHAGLHKLIAPPSLPSQCEQMEAWVADAVDFSAAQKEEARQHLSRLPDETSVCHGDFHPGNIILTARGPVIIDWSRGTSGYALADVARTSVLFESAPVPANVSWRLRVLIKVARRALHATYLKRYFQLCPASPAELEWWRVPQRLAGSAWRAREAAAIAMQKSESR